MTRRTIPVAVRSDRFYRVGVDIGGTNIKVGLVKDGKLEARMSVPTVVHDGPQNAIERTARAIQRLSRDISDCEPKSVGIAIPGLIDGRVLRQARHLPGWNDVQVCEQFEYLLGIPAFLEGDARAAAIGEIYVGLGRAVDRGVALTLGTGLGGATFERIGSEYLLSLPTFAVGMLLAYDPDKAGGAAECYIEDLVSGTAIVKRAVARLSSDYRKLDPNHGAMAVFELAESGDSACQEIVQEAGHHLGLLLADLVNLFNPEEIVIGGGVAAGGSRLLDAAEITLNRFAVPILLAGARVSLSRIAGASGVYGAAYLSFLR